MSGERKPGFVINRPALVVELSQQLEVFKEKLQQLTERSLEAEDAERVQNERAESLGRHNGQLESNLSCQTKSGVSEEAGLMQKVATLREEREALKQAFEKRDAALQASRKHVSELRQTLTKERAVAFGGSCFVLSCLTDLVNFGEFSSSFFCFVFLL